MTPLASMTVLRWLFRNSSTSTLMVNNCQDESAEHMAERTSSDTGRTVVCAKNHSFVVLSIGIGKDILYHNCFRVIPTPSFVLLVQLLRYVFHHQPASQSQRISLRFQKIFVILTLSEASVETVRTIQQSCRHAVSLRQCLSH